jgi:hypothetical protein
VNRSVGVGLTVTLFTLSLGALSHPRGVQTLGTNAIPDHAAVVPTTPSEIGPETMNAPAIANLSAEVDRVVPVAGVTRGEPIEEPVDLYGNEVSHAVATYTYDHAGSLYEEHSPQTEVPRLTPPIS